jgi:hypothetical protein
MKHFTRINEKCPTLPTVQQKMTRMSRFAPPCREKTVRARVLPPRKTFSLNARTRDALWDRISRGLPRSASSSQRVNQRTPLPLLHPHQSARDTSPGLPHPATPLCLAEDSRSGLPLFTSSHQSAQIAPSMLGHHHYGLLNCIQSGLLLFCVVYSTSV